jgi:hypothetical protein
MLVTRGAEGDSWTPGRGELRRAVVIVHSSPHLIPMFRPLVFLFFRTFGLVGQTQSEEWNSAQTASFSVVPVEKERLF